MKYDVHYADPALLTGLADGGRIKRGLAPLSLDAFDRCYRYVGTFEASGLEALFALLQDGGGGLAEATMQRYVLRRVKHSSLSTGDVAVERDSGQAWLLALEGWKKIELA